MPHYLFLDVEIPNNRHNSLCSIGIVNVNSEGKSQEIYQLINPEDRFDPIPVQVHGIEEAQVLHEPTLKDFWPKICPLFEDAIVIGHNITSDLSALCESLHRYQIEIPPLQYIDLLPLARKYIQSDSYALSDLCLRYDYRFDMHHALNDAKAAQMLFEVMDQEFSISKTKPKTYTFKHKTQKTIDPKLANRINELAGIIDGILYDRVVTDEEIEYLKKWMKDCSRFKCYETFDNIIQNLELLLNQEQHGKQFLEELYHVVETIEGSSLYTDYTLAMQYLLGILKGITSDNVLADSEIIRLKQWVDENDWLEDEPYYARLEDALYGMDFNEITDDDRQELMEVIQAILTPVTKKATPKKRRKSVAIDWTDKTFCMTGNFETMARKDFGKQLTSLGAICKDSVTKTLDYLIVGGLGSDAWKYGNSGGAKISQAKKIQDSGGCIQILSEEDVLKGLEML